MADDREDSGSSHSTPFSVTGIWLETELIDLCSKMNCHPGAKSVLDIGPATCCESSSESREDGFGRKENVRILFDAECGNQIKKAR